MAKAKPAAKRAASIQDEIEALLERRGYVDWAFCIRSVDGVTRTRWAAGDGKNPSGDRERMAVLHFEMRLLQREMEDYQLRPRK